MILNCCSREKIISNASDDKMWGLITYDTIFTVFITLFVFTTGILIDRLIKYYEKKKEKKELRYYFKHFLDIITDKTCPQLIEMYAKVYYTNGINEGIPTTPPKILTDNFTRIRKIHDKELFNAFKDKDSFSKILSNIDFLELIIGEIDSFNKQIRSESDEIKKPLQEDINKYFDILGKYVEHIRVNNPQYDGVTDFHNLVNNSILIYHKQPEMKVKLTEVYKKIIRPIQEQVVQTNIFRSDPLGYEIAELGKSISLRYSYLKRMTIEFRLAYRQFSRHVKDRQDALIKARQKINWD